MPPRIDRDRRRLELAEAVWAIIRRRGLRAVSVRTIAAEAGVAVGSLRHVFPTRSELLRFSAELMLQRATDRILATPRTGDPAVDARAVLLHLLPLEDESRAELEVNVALIAETPALTELGPLRDRAHEQLASLCGQVVAALAPTLEPERLLTETRRLHALLDGLATHIVLNPPEHDPSWALVILDEEIARLSTRSE